MNTIHGFKIMAIDVCLKCILSGNVIYSASHCENIACFVFVLSRMYRTTNYAKQKIAGNQIGANCSMQTVDFVQKGKIDCSKD